MQIDTYNVLQICKIDCIKLICNQCTVIKYGTVCFCFHQLQFRILLFFIVQGAIANQWHFSKKNKISPSPLIIKIFIWNIQGIFFEC